MISSYHHSITHKAYRILSSLDDSHMTMTIENLVLSNLIFVEMRNEISPVLLWQNIWATFSCISAKLCWAEPFYTLESQAATLCPLTNWLVSITSFFNAGKFWSGWREGEIPLFSEVYLEISAIWWLGGGGDFLP